jgi:hypothetical protein
MKLKITQILVFAVIFASVAYTANAQTGVKADTKSKLQGTTTKTEMFNNFKEQRKEIMKKMKRSAFENRRDTLVKHLRNSLESLANIRGRINDRIINAEKTGRIMTEAKAALVIADGKIAKARVAVDALAVVNTIASSTGAVATSTDVDLSKPRQIGDAAIKAVKEARDALRNANVLVAQNMGLGKIGGVATTTATTTTVTSIATTTATTTTTTATTTATTTSN